MLAIFPTGLHAQSADTASEQGRASAEVVKSIQVQPEAELQFGAIIVGIAQSGEVIVGHQPGAVAYLGAARSGCGAGGGCATHAAGFLVLGEALRTYRISTGSLAVARGAATGVALEVRDLTVLSANIANASGLGQLDSAGMDHFSVGGTLAIPAGTAPDIFRADLPVMVAYE